MGTRVHRFIKHPDLTPAPERKRHQNFFENSLPSTSNPRSFTRNTDNPNQKLRVRFVLPEENNVDRKERKEIEVFPDPTEFQSSPYLPAICELMVFSQKMDSKKIKRKTALPKKSIVRKTNEDSTNKLPREPKANCTKIKLPPATPNYSKQELKIDSNCMLPEDYKEPTPVDTRRRIVAWLDEAEKAKPTYRRRMDSFTS